MKILLPLMPDRQHRHGFPVLDLEQGNVSICAKLDYQFAQEGVIRCRLAASEGKISQHVDTFADGSTRPPRCFRITLAQKVLQA